jgi:hypothetical protein
VSLVKGKHFRLNESKNFLLKWSDEIIIFTCIESFIYCFFFFSLILVTTAIIFNAPSSSPIH